MNSAVVWHDLECGGYEQDLPLWVDLAAAHAHDPRARILDVGAGTGRVSLALAGAGHRVTALDQDAELLAALTDRAGALAVETVQGDARAFHLPGEGFALCIVPMQTVQLLGGADGRAAFMDAAKRHLVAGGVLAVAVAVAEDFEEFEWQDGDPFPLPDMVEHEGYVYCSQPTAVRRQGDTFVLERRREIIDPAGNQRRTKDVIVLDVVSAAGIVEAGQRAGLHPLGVRLVAPTGEHIGSEVIILGA